MTIASRLTADGVLLTNGYFDEITKNWVSITPDVIYAGLFDETFLDPGSIDFPSSGNYLNGVNNVFNIGASGTAWTFETWVFPETSGAVFAIGNGTQYGQSLAIDWGYAVANKFTVRQGDGSSYPIAITTTNSYLANSWYHVAISCSVTGVRGIYINGVLDNGATSSVSLSSANQWIVNGFYDNNGVGNNGLTGYISNLRLVVGSSLYSANFTPPYAPLVSVTNTELLLCTPNNGGAFIDTSPNNFRVLLAGNPTKSSNNPFTLNTVQRKIASGTLQVKGYFDESSGIT
jgi:Concanavalin A-like lectin/glucanases superfamily